MYLHASHMDAFAHTNMFTKSDMQSCFIINVLSMQYQQYVGRADVVNYKNTIVSSCDCVTIYRNQPPKLAQTNSGKSSQHGIRRHFCQGGSTIISIGATYQLPLPDLRNSSDVFLHPTNLKKDNIRKVWGCIIISYTHH